MIFWGVQLWAAYGDPELFTLMVAVLASTQVVGLAWGLQRVIDQG